MRKQKIYDYLFELMVNGDKQLHPKTAKVLIDLGYVKEFVKKERWNRGIFEYILHTITPMGEDYLLDHLREIGKDYKD